MARNVAIVIGINEYDHLQRLKYAKRDAQLIQDFFTKQAGCEKVFFFSDDSPLLRGKPTRPNRANLRKVLLDLGENSREKRVMKAGDNFWFFFSGHGIRYEERDYLMPCDGNSRDIKDTGIAIDFIIDQLRKSGADNVVLILDACRSEGEKSGKGIGEQTAKQARNTGVISFFSCEPNQSSYEIEELEQGAFTCALLEGLTGQNPCVTVEKLDQYLCERVPLLNQAYNKPPQTPYTVIEPRAKNHLILLPNATPEDIEPLKREAYQAENGHDLELAKQFWIRVDDASSGKDEDAVKALERIRMESSSPSPAPDNQNPPKPEYPPSKDQPKPDDKRKKSLLVTGGGIVTTLTVVGIIYVKLQPKVPPCYSTKDLCKIFPQAGNGKEYTWPDEEDIQKVQKEDPNSNYEPPTYKYVSNDRDCGGSSLPVLKLQYEFPDKNQPYSGWAVYWANGFDVSKFSTLELRIKSGSENKELKFEVGLVDRKGNGDENKITYVAPNDWQPISIPLKEFDNKIKKSEIEYIKIGFLREHGSGTICIDKIELR